MSNDIERIRREVSLPATVQSFGVQIQADGNEFEACCPLHGENTPSFTLFAGKDGVWRFHCFGCGAGGDVIDFVEKLQGVDTKEAIAILGGRQRRGENVAPVSTTPPRDIYAGINRLDPIGTLAAGEKIVLYNPKREQNGNIKPSAVYPYHRLDGSLIGYVLRHDLPGGGKETPMVQWANVPGVGDCWCRLPFDKPRPLYGLGRLVEGQVFVVEGEKCADALHKATGKNVVTWPGGTYGVGHCDWSPLAGRDVLIWPDFDVPGYSTAKRVGEQLSAIAKRIRFIDVGKELRRERDDF